MMSRSTRWIVFFVALGMLACNLPGLPDATPAAAPTATAGLSFPTTTPLPSATPTETAVPPTATATAIPGGQAVPGCDIAWFFVFRSGQTEPGCPDTPVVVDAVGEDFIGGRVYRYGPTPDFPDQHGTVFVIYNNGTWETRVDSFTAGDPDTDPSIKPPSNRFQPTGAIGKVWRDPVIREALGWAYGPPAQFTGRYQNPKDDNTSIFVDHGKGLILRLTTSATGYRSWKVVGDY